jgi:hypothetical protein
MKNEKESFWKTLPGVLTAIAAIITAISGLVLGLYNVGVFSNTPSPTLSSTPPETSTTNPPPTSTTTPPANTETYPSDKIIHYRIIDLNDTYLKIEVEYSYDPIHGKEVYIGGNFVDKDGNLFGGYIVGPWLYNDSGTATLGLVYDGPKRESTELLIFLAEAYKSGFISARYGYARTWGT